MCALDPESESNPGVLSIIAYTPKDPDATDDVTDVATLMINLPWRQVYGLTYNEVLQLPFDEWCELYRLLSKHEETKPQSPIVNAITLLTERLTQLMCVAFNLKRNEETSSG